MSQGSPRVTIRLPQPLLDLIEQTIERRNSNTSLPPWSMSDFIQNAIWEKLDHMKRSRRRPKKKTAASTETNFASQSIGESSDGIP